MALQNNPDVNCLEEAREWYANNGDQEVIDKYSRFLIDILPGLKVDEIKGMTCVTCGNPSDLPYIDGVSATVTVAVVGNGRGATICDEVGRIAAQLSLTGHWDSELPKKLFEAIF
ncbi:DAO domain-containing protein [Caerostris extrusa]|uniref:DAO domain-containing protein n=1 Tax=Caerostris extrusa TaxID=172846 RepID=A0AAV4WRR8_CAEEX|nr:DAO domain-containing protein [Caerostris extrusa]